MADIGSTLRETRMRARIDISEVEARTKIRAKYLRAIENEEWDLLPGPVYVKSFLRTYGDYLGLDSRALIDEFKRRYERPADHELRPMTSRSRERERERERGGRQPSRPKIPPWVAIAAVLVIVGVVLAAIGLATAPKSTTTTSPGSARGTRPHHHHRSTTPTVTTPTTTTRRPGRRRARTASVRITPTSSVWLCVVTVAHGKQTPVFPAGTYSAGQNVPTAHGHELLVTLGNAGATLTLNGKPYPLTASSQAIGLKVTASEITLLPPGTGPTCT
jgi:cytoskeletal protein RodZ